jgi:hypothetical protein
MNYLDPQVIRSVRQTYEKLAIKELTTDLPKSVASGLPRKWTHSMLLLKKTEPNYNFGRRNLKTPSVYKIFTLKRC